VRRWGRRLRLVEPGAEWSIELRAGHLRRSSLATSACGPYPCSCQSQFA